MPEMYLHNTLTRRKEKFVPLDENNVRMYVCGPTVYDRAHLGNAKSAVVFDVLNRVLREVYGKDHVTYVSNITDIDDKILNKHQETGKPISEITRADDFRPLFASWFFQFPIGSSFFPKLCPVV